MCLAQGPQRSDAQVRLEPATPRSRHKHSTTEPLRSLWRAVCAVAQLVKCWTGDRSVASSRLTAGGGTVLCP